MCHKSSRGTFRIPKVLGALIYSESSFRAREHALKGVIGLAGINTPIWNDTCPYSPYSDPGNINSAAWILSTYLVESHGDYHEALAHYKGYSALGKKQAQHVLDVRYKYFK